MTDATTEIAAIERTLELPAPPERVWRALSDPEEIAQWFGDTAELELRPGGGGWFGWESHGRFAVRVEEVVPAERLVWSWARKPETPFEEGPTTRVEWTLQRRSDGGTTLRMRESGFLTTQAREENVGGWKAELAELRELLEA